MPTTSRTSVLVLGGGPDAERDVSIRSSSAIAAALQAAGRFDVRLEIIERITPAALQGLPGDVLFPYLHGPWGEGGPLQDIVAADGRPSVGCGPRAARLAMDKLATKGAALRAGIPTPPFFALDLRDPACPIDLPAIVKPVHEGSTVGLFVCERPADYAAAQAAVRELARRGEPKAYMVEPRVPGRELTVGVVDRRALPIIEIAPKDGLYDYEAKYVRSDTQYLLAPPLPAGVAETVTRQSIALFDAVGCRHIARVDWMLDPAGVAWMLEINTTPGFTDHSLVPKAAAHAGIPMPVLCAELVEMALRDGPARG